MRGIAMIRNFNLSDGNVDNFITKLKALDLVNIRYVANVVEKETIRGKLQNDGYWQFIKEFADYLGYDKDFVHDLLRYKFLYEIIDIEGNEHRRLLSTTKQSVKYMARYIDDCLRYAAENGFVFEFKHG